MAAQQRRNFFLSGSSFPHVTPQTTRISSCNLQSESCCNYTPGSSSFPLLNMPTRKRKWGKYAFQCWWKFSCKVWKVGGGRGDDMKNVLVAAKAWQFRPVKHFVPEHKLPSFMLKVINDKAETSSACWPRQGQHALGDSQTPAVLNLGRDLNQSFIAPFCFWGPGSLLKGEIAVFQIPADGAEKTESKLGRMQFTKTLPASWNSGLLRAPFHKAITYWLWRY